MLRAQPEQLDAPVPELYKLGGQNLRENGRGRWIPAAGNQAARRIVGRRGESMGREGDAETNRRRGGLTRCGMRRRGLAGTGQGGREPAVESGPGREGAGRGVGRWSPAAGVGRGGTLTLTLAGSLLDGEWSSRLGRAKSWARGIDDPTVQFHFGMAGAGNFSPVDGTRRRQIGGYG